MSITPESPEDPFRSVESIKMNIYSTAVVRVRREIWRGRLRVRGVWGVGDWRVLCPVPQPLGPEVRYDPLPRSLAGADAATQEEATLYI